jgi:type I restriction enzyme S subunit
MSLVRSGMTKFAADWKVLPFEDAIEDATGGNVKVQTREYRESGRLRVIDQGQAEVAGYVDDEGLACRAQLPCILFGDHTRIFKFATEPFALGADGVKVLVPRKGLEPRFAYHYLRTVRLPEDAGYSRHFKFLKEALVPLPPVSEQRRIADILDKADAIRRKRKEAIALTEELLRSAFLEMFGDPVTNPKGWEVKPLGEVAQVNGGLQVTHARSVNPISMPYLRVANVFRERLDLAELKEIRVTPAEAERARLMMGDVLIVEGHGNPDELGRAAVWNGAIDVCTHQNHLIRVRLDSTFLLPIFLSAYLNSSAGKAHMLRMGKTTSGLNTISTNNVRSVSVLIPPIRRQRDFVRLVDANQALNTKLSRAACDAEVLFASLVQSAFRGELHDGQRGKHRALEPGDDAEGAHAP